MHFLRLRRFQSLSTERRAGGTRSKEDGKEDMKMQDAEDDDDETGAIMYDAVDVIEMIP